MITRLALATSLLTASLAGLATGAHAADLPSRMAAPAPAPLVKRLVHITLATSSWTGGYIGLTASYDIWRNLSTKPNGFGIGARVGYDYELSHNIVVGLMAEGDLNLGHKDWTRSITVNAPGGPPSTTVYTGSIRHRDTFSLDGRLGYAIDTSNLLYVLGATRVRTRPPNPPPPSRSAHPRATAGTSALVWNTSSRRTCLSSANTVTTMSTMSARSARAARPASPAPRPSTSSGWA